MKLVNQSRVFRKISLARALVCMAIGFGATGCEQDEGATTTPPEPLVDVPEIKGSVAAADFCGLADQIYCAGAVGCCSGADVVYGSVEECLQATRCEMGLGGVLAGPLVQNGELKYDADAAGNYLRDLEAAVSQCGHHPDSVTRPTFLIGTRDVNADCAPQGDDIANTFTCKPGLVCAPGIDAMTGEKIATCQAAPPPPTDGDIGEACATGEDCRSGVCQSGKCAVDVSAEYCMKAPPNGPPANADPTHLYVDLSGDNSGTSGDITLKYLNGGKFWSCTITDTLSDGQEKVCAVTGTGTVTNSNKEYFILEMNSSDGAKIDTVCACSAADGNKCSSAIECAGTFNDYGDRASWCIGGSFNIGLWANACSSVWLDNDGHGKCTKLQVDSYDDNFTWCTD